MCIPAGSWGSAHFGVTAEIAPARTEPPTVVTRLIESATHRFVESEFAQLIALFAAWRQDIDSEPFSHEGDWATIDAPAFRVVPTWPQRQPTLPEATPELP